MAAATSSFSPPARGPLKVSVIGGGSFGTAVACVAAEGAKLNTATFDDKVTLWVRRPELAEEINTKHTNNQYWPGPMPENILGVSDMKIAAEGVGVCVIGVPGEFVPATIEQLRPHLDPSCIIVSLIKSLRVESGEVVPYVRHLAAELKDLTITALMGPNIYKEMAKGEFAEATIGVADPAASKVLHKLFNTPKFAVKCVTDVEAVDLCGCLKNTITIACGFSEGLGWGGNVRAAIIRRGLQEIMAFLKEFLPDDRPGKLDPQSVIFEACGVGDLVLSCTVGRGRLLAAEFVKHGCKRSWDELEQETMNGMKLPDWHNVQYVRGLLDAKGRLGDYPLLAQTYAIAFAGADPTTIINPLRSDGSSD